MPVEWKVVNVRAQGDNAFIEVQARENSGFHIYGLGEKNSLPNSTQFLFDQKVHVVDIQTHPSHFKKESPFKSVGQEQIFKIQVKLRDPATTHEIMFSVRYSACTNKICIPPERLGLKANIESQKNTSFTAQSSAEKVQLLELFSSEGCSSCPPTETWMRSLRSQTGLWKSFVPLEFHVDYWNNLGWSDPYSQAEFSARQRTYAAQGKAASVYTPGVFCDGQEWRDWSRSAAPKASKRKLASFL